MTTGRTERGVGTVRKYHVARRERGMTLIEVLVTTVALGFLAIGAVHLYAATFGVHHKIAGEFDLRRAAAQVVEELGSGFRAGGQELPGVSGAAEVRVTSSADAATIELSAGNVTVTYLWDRESGELRRRINQGAAETLLTRVANFQVTCVEEKLVHMKAELAGAGSPPPRVTLEA